MKIRQGFVSNSSSSSFVILLPKNFDPDMYVDNMEDSEIEKILSDHDVKSKKKIKEYLTMLVKDKGIYSGDNYKAFYMCSDVLDEFVITEVEGGPDDGSITLLSEKERERLKNLLNKEIRYDKLNNINKEEKLD
jgi:hypothetical protein